MNGTMIGTDVAGDRVGILAQCMYCKLHERHTVPLDQMSETVRMLTQHACDRSVTPRIRPTPLETPPLQLELF